MKLSYLLLDVFTRKRLAGNPLAVVFKADGLTTERMQAIAFEFNLSETVFVMKPKLEKHTAALRIFTPRVELPFAGHPTVGAAVALGLINRATAVRLEEQVGVITCVVDKIERQAANAHFSLPVLPEEFGPAPGAGAIATALGIDLDEIGCGAFRPAAYSAGVPFYLVPVRDAAVLQKLKLERRGWAETFPLGRGSIYVFTLTPDEPGIDIAARMFGGGLGVGEDPATGSAAAALIGLLATRAPDGQSLYTLRQGYEMGRPSQISMQLRKVDDRLVHGGIGGDAVVVGEGTIEVDE